MTKELKENNKRGKVFFINDELLYLPAIAEACGYEAGISQSSKIIDNFSDAKKFNPDFLVVNISFAKFREYLENLAKFKESSPKTRVIVTGEPFLTYNNNVTYENSFIDYAIIGEPEFVLRDILEGEADADIMGICYTDDNMQSAKNEMRPYIENLDTLPFPARHLRKDNKTAIIEVSRGCPYHCFFCLATAKNGAAHRTRTADSIIKEIKDCIEKFGTSRFYFKSDNFNFDKNWVINLCKKIIQSGVKIHWYCDLTPKDVDDNLAKIMYKSGCRLCKIGAESGSEEILKKLDKDITKESIKETVKILRKNKIKTLSMFMFGLPWETEKTAEETTKFAQEIKSDDVMFNIAIPLPATKFFIYSMLNKLFLGKPDFSDKSAKVIVKSHELRKERIAELKTYAENKYNRNIFQKITNYLKQLLKKSK